MNKSILGIIGLLLIYVFSISFSGKTGGEIGKFIPELKIQQGDSIKANISEMQKGRTGYTLLNFWKTTDAESRLNGKLYQIWMAEVSDDAKSPNYIAVNLDEKENYREIITKTDRLDSQYQYITNADVNTVIKKFEMKKGLKSFLIDDNGEIIMINPSTSVLTEFFNQLKKAEEKF